jgi:Zn-dependent protease
MTALPSTMQRASLLPLSADLRAALERAQQEAARRQSVYVDVEHLLLGLLSQAGNPACELLRTAQADPSALYEQVAGAVGIEREPAVTLKGYTRPASQVVERAVQTARQLGHNALDSRHLLLSLFDERDGAVHETLSALSLTPEEVRADLRRQPPAPSTTGSPAVAGQPAEQPEIVVIPTRRKARQPSAAGNRWGRWPWVLAGVALLIYLLAFLPGGSLFTFVFVLIGWVFSVTLHEFAHALVAYWGGDYTVKDKGYLSFNPLKYTHPMLSIGLPLLFLAMGGIGLPGGAVYIERHRLRSKWWSMAVSAAGPSANLLLAILLSLPFALGLVDTDVIEFSIWLGRSPEGTSIWQNAPLWSAVAFLIMLQVTAVCFNLLPIPPLDGFGIIEPLLDQRTRWQMLQIGSYGLLLVFLALWFIPPVANSFWQMIFDITHALQIPDELVREGFRNFMFWREPPS